MNTLQEEEVLALAIINNKNFADAYQLCKVLAWKFKIINCSEIIGRIENKKFVSVKYPNSNTLKSFELTNDGSKILYENKNELSKILIDKFPKELNFIEKLLF